MAAPSAEGVLRGRRIGLIYPTSANLFFRDLAEGVREAAAARGVGVMMRECGESIERQRAELTDLLAQGVAALIVSPVDSAGIGPVLAEAQRDDVPVITVDRAASDCPVVSHVASDNLLGGRMAADFLAGSLGDRGNVAIVGYQGDEGAGRVADSAGGGSPSEGWGTTSIAERVRGFKDALGGHPGLRLTAEVSGGSTRQRSREVTYELLRSYPEVAGLFVTSDVTVQGALDAIRLLGREDDVVVVGFDATPQACGEILRGGPLRGEVAQFPMRIGHTAVELWADHAHGMAVPPRVAIPVELVTADNVQRFTGAERLLHVQRGEVWTAGERVVFFPVRGYQMMLNEVHAANPDLLRSIVYRSGFVLGESIAEQVRELYPDPRDRLFVLLEDLARGGFGTFELVDLDLDSGQATVRGQNLFEAAIAPDLVWTRTPRCVDNYCSGRLAGYLTAIFRRPTTCEEVLCEGRGDPHCQFAITAESS